MTPIVIDRIQVFAVSVRPPRGPESSLGSMPVRNGLLIAVTSVDGIEGWGEAWCNFPPRGNLSRLYLMEDVIGPRLLGRGFERYDDCRPALESDFMRIALHTGEAGPFSHCLAAVDTALADIAARREGLSLCAFLKGVSRGSVPVYASTPDVSRLEASIEEMISEGHTAAKLKIGFDRATDISLLERFRGLAGDSLAVMADANQNWSLEEAKEMVRAVAGFDLEFIEEPLAANAPKELWADLAAASPVPIAAGENITSGESFREFARKGGLSVLQPDMAKWGGVSGTCAVGREAREAGLTCAMHYMGTAVGLAATTHILAAVGGDGPMELDANPNPLRTGLGEIDLSVSHGQLKLPAGAGIGFRPDPAALNGFTVGTADMH